MRKYNKEVVAKYEKYLDGEYFEVIVTNEDTYSDGEKYYNVHILSEKYCKDELNTLFLQEPHSCIENPKEYFSKEYLVSRLMEHFIWDRFYDEGIARCSVDIEKFEEH